MSGVEDMKGCRKGVVHGANCIECKKKEIESLRKELQAIKAENENFRSALGKEGETFVKALLDNEKLKEQLARMAQDVNKVLADSETGDGWGPDITTGDFLRDALSSYDPKWIAGVRVEARDEALSEELLYLKALRRDRNYVSDDRIELVKLMVERLEKKSRQPNQSREKMG